MRRDALPANSLAEAHLYLMVTPCDACGDGPLVGGDAVSLDATCVAPTNDPNTVSAVRITTSCKACGASGSLTCTMPHGRGTDPAGGPATINPTDHPSRIIDVAQWLTLFRTIVEAAHRETDKVRARELGIEAARCLDEALKFYDDPDSELPPDDALFHEPSRRAYRTSPQHFARKRLLDLRSKLPSIAAMNAKRHTPTPKRPWWRFRR
ncbi:MAG: hypothetical protein ACE5E6_06240 [Phycisphaerae bacterium]